MGALYGGTVSWSLNIVGRRANLRLHGDGGLGGHLEAAVVLVPPAIFLRIFTYVYYGKMLLGNRFR
jgi:hypothetical protein